LLPGTQRTFGCEGDTRRTRGPITLMSARTGRVQISGRTRSGREIGLVSGRRCEEAVSGNCFVMSELGWLSLQACRRAVARPYFNASSAGASARDGALEDRAFWRATAGRIGRALACEIWNTRLYYARGCSLDGLRRYGLCVRRPMGNGRLPVASKYDAQVEGVRVACWQLDVRCRARGARKPGGQPFSLQETFSSSSQVRA